MAHVYHVDIVEDDGSTGTYAVTLPDHHHHSLVESTAAFFSLLATVMAVSKDCIKAYRYFGKK